jgi:hypothetical protein
MFEHFWAEEYFKYIKGELSSVIWKFLFIPGTLENAGF